MSVTFTGWQITLLWVAATLFGLLLSGRGKDRKNKPIARLVAILLEPIYFWLDLYDPAGRPSHSKVAYIVTLGVMLVGVVAFGIREARGGGLSINFILFAAATMAYGLGRSAYNAFLHSTLKDRLAGLMDQRRTSTMTAAPPPPGLRESGAFPKEEA